MTYDRGGSAGYRSFVDLGEAAEKRLTARPWIAQRPALCACHTASEAPHFRHWTEINKGPLKKSSTPYVSDANGGTALARRVVGQVTYGSQKPGAGSTLAGSIPRPSALFIAIANA